MLANRLFSVWKGLKQSLDQSLKVVGSGFNSELNRFQLRFDSSVLSKILNLKNKLLCSDHVPFDVSSVVKTFKHCNVGRSPGPDL